MSAKKIHALLAKHGKSKYILADAFPGFSSHRIGYEPSEKFIVVLIKSTNGGGADYSANEGAYLSIHYNVSCTIKTKGSRLKKNEEYTLLTLRTKEIGIEHYFIELVCIYIRKLGNIPSIEDVKNEYLKLESIFLKLSKSSKLDILGLWGELFIIEKSSHPEYLISSWHISSKAKMDFNDCIDKVEIKTTTRKRRCHSFEIKQLWKYKGGLTIISSVMTEEIESGHSISDLIGSIKLKISVSYYQELINKVFDVVGDKIEGVDDYRFDYNMALSEIKYFDANKIPRPGLIPKEVTSVKFEVDLTGIKSVSRAKLKSKLLKGI